jgi:hypothetical protein
MKRGCILIGALVLMAAGSKTALCAQPKTEPLPGLKIETGSQTQVRISDVMVTHDDSQISSISFTVTNTTFPPICFIRLQIWAPNMRRVMVNGTLPGVEDNGFFVACLTWGTNPCNGATAPNATDVQLPPDRAITLTLDTHSLLHFPSYSNALEFPPTLTLILTRSCFGDVNVALPSWNDRGECLALNAKAP